MRRTTTSLVVLLAVSLLAASSPSRAAAHAGYERSSPTADAVVRESPPQVEVWFSQDLFRRAGANTLTVTGPDGQDIGVGETVIDSADRKHVSALLSAALAPGTYTVRWTSLSATDGDPAEGTFRFTIDPAAPQTSSAATTTATTSPNGGGTERASGTAADVGSSSLPSDGASASPFPLWALLVGLAIILAGVAVAGALLASNRDRTGRG